MANSYFIFLSIISEDGRQLVSTSSKSKHRIRGIIYRDVEINKYGFVSTVFVSRWIPVSKPLPKQKYGNDMELFGPYLTHRWEWYGKVRW